MNTPRHEPCGCGCTVDYSDVTPATGTDPDNRPIIDSLANKMPTSDMPDADPTLRADPDKIIPGPEAASAVDLTAQDASVQQKG